MDTHRFFLFSPRFLNSKLRNDFERKQGLGQAVATAYQYPKFRNTVLFCHKSYFFPMIKNGLYLANFPQIFNVLYKIPSALVFKYNVLILRHQNWQN